MLVKEAEETEMIHNFPPAYSAVPDCLGSNYTYLIHHFSYLLNEDNSTCLLDVRLGP